MQDFFLRKKGHFVKSKFTLIEATAEYRPHGSIPTTNDERADPRLEGINLLHEETQVIISNNCLTYHQSQAKSIGPSYAQIAECYQAVTRLSLAMRLKEPESISTIRRFLMEKRLMVC
jgi:hypothetical protein